MTDDPKDAPLRRVVRDMRSRFPEFDRHVIDPGTLTGWADAIEAALEANTRHTPEGGLIQCRACGAVRGFGTDACLCGERSWKQAAPQSGAPDAPRVMRDFTLTNVSMSPTAPDAQLVRTEAGRRVDAPDAAESSSGERLGRANDSASGVAPRPQTPGGAPDAPRVVAHCGWCPRVGIKQGLEEYCPGIAPAPMTPEEREALELAVTYTNEWAHRHASYNDLSAGKAATLAAATIRILLDRGKP